jgi:hypothetical protein
MTVIRLDLHARAHTHVYSYYFAHLILSVHRYYNNNGYYEQSGGGERRGGKEVGEELFFTIQF